MTSAPVTGFSLARGFVASQVRWPLVRATEIFELRYGKALTDPARQPGPVPVFGTNGRCGWHSSALFEAPGVILGRKGQGPLGVEWTDSPYWVIDTAYSLSLRRPDVDLRYAYYLIKFVGLNHLKDGTSNPSLSRDTFGTQLFPLPPLQDQRHVARILRLLDDKIELNRQISATLEAIARALFKSWFANFPVATDRRSSPHRQRSSGWPVVRLGDVLQLQRGTTYESRLLDLPGPVLLGLGTIEPGGGFRSAKLKTYGGESPEKLLVRPGEMYVALKGATKDGSMVGSVARLPPSVPVGRLTQDTVRLALNDVGIKLQRYLYWAMRAPEYREYCEQRATGSAQVGLSRRDFLNYEVVIPPREMLTDFTRFDENAAAQTDSRERESEMLAELRDMLLPKLLSGELRIRDAEKAVEPVL